jgi:UDP-N-acetylmuramate--alanine ligase
MDRPEIISQQKKIQAIHQYDIVETITRPIVKGKRYHLIGAGGIGMSGLAHILIHNGAIVSGSDQNAGVLGRLMDCFQSIAISGTHGKSTTSGWLVYCLKEAGIDVNFLVGAYINQIGSSAGAGSSQYFIAEACEYDRSFLNMKPTMGCILNIDRDHLDCYKNQQEIIDAFEQFALKTKFSGLLIANGQDENIKQVISTVGDQVPYQTFGLGARNDYYVRNLKKINGRYTFDVYFQGEHLGTTQIALPGLHNVLNALAVIAMATNIGVETKLLFDLVGQFTGVNRRLMLKDHIYDITVLDDYAHHPTEIKASLKAIRERYNPKRLICIFQAHQYSRTQILLDDFAKCFKLADIVIVPEIYFVRDSLESKQQINAQILAERISAEQTQSRYIGQFSDVCDYLINEAVAGDIVVTMGAGDVWKIADEYIQRLRKNC